MQSSSFDGYCFSFADDTSVRRFLEAESLGAYAADVVGKMPRLYLACPNVDVSEGVRRLEEEGFSTVVRLPLKSDDARCSVARQLEQLAGDGPPVQLFLTRIKKLVVVSMSGKPLELSRDVNTVCNVGDLELLEVTCGAQAFVIAQQRIPFEEVINVIRCDVAAERLPESWLRWEGDAVVSLAVSSEGPPLTGRLYNFLPMGAEARAPLNAHLDGPFYASVDRLRLQAGVKLNDLLLKTARHLSVGGAKLAKAHLPAKRGRQVATDLIAWSGDGASEVRATLLDSGEALVPALKAGAPSGWSGLRHARVWKGDEYITPEFASRFSDLRIVDPAIGAHRIAALVAFASHVHMSCSAQEQADVVESIARHLEKRRAKFARWDAFYRSLSQLFRSDPSVLAGRRLLLTARGEVHATESIDGQPQKGRKRRRRLSSVFLPPLRGAERTAKATIDLPRAVQRRLAYVAPELEIARDGASPARRFLVAAGLVRDHESREILRLLSTAMTEPGDVKEPEALRWQALDTMMKIVTAEDTADGVVSDLNSLLPTREGWTRANLAYFSGRWTGARSADLERLFDEAQGVSPELDEHARHLLLAYPDWRVRSHDRGAWIAFLRKAGVRDHLRPVPAIAGASPRAFPGVLPNALAQRTGLPKDQGQTWRALMKAESDLPNPQTSYTASGVFRLPGQLDYDALGPTVGRSYAIQVIRALQALPSITRMSVYRPSPQHRFAENRREWPSPVEAFLRGAAWVPLASGERARLSNAWLPSRRGQVPPVGLPIVDFDLVSVLLQSEEAAKRLRRAGLSEYGDPAHAWRFLKAAGDVVAAGVERSDGERFMAAAREAWQHANLHADPPDGLQLIGRRQGAVVTVDLGDAEGPPLLVADGDDRQLVAASVRSNPQTVVFDPPRSRALEIGRYLAAHLPGRVRRSSGIEATYESEGRLVAFDPQVPFIGDILGDAIREVVALSLRYRNSFYRGDVELALQQLSKVRLRWLPELWLRVGDVLEPVPRFAERAVLMPSDEGPTLLVSSSLQGSGRTLIAIAEALGSAIGSRRLVGEPLLAFAAQLGEYALQCSHEEYARALDLPVEEVRGVLSAARASVANLLRIVRPLVALFAGEEPARKIVPGAGLSTEDDILRALQPYACDLPIAPEELIRRCRESSGLEAIALGLRVNLADLNVVLSALGPPYAPLDLTERHTNTLALFLERKEALVRESIRAAYWPQFERGENLADYLAARDAPRPTLPDDFGRSAIELPRAQLSEWLNNWMRRLGVNPIISMPSGRNSIEVVREVNVRHLRELAREIRIAVLRRADAADPLRAAFGDISGAEKAVTTAATRGGWCDFDRLDDAASLTWLSRCGLWPVGWPKSLAELGVTDEERANVAAADERARADALTKRRIIEYTGGSFTVGVDNLANLSDQISGLVAGNSVLLRTSTRVVRSAAPKLVSSQKKRGRGRGSGGGSGLSDEEREVIGFFGEVIAFNWLKRRFGRSRVVDLSCWKSDNRRYLANEPGDDRLGYDFEIRNGGTRWFFEVKATATDDPRSRQLIEVGSSEIAHAEICRTDRRMRYRILYILDALHPERARIFVLANPRSRAGQSFYADSLSAGVKLLFQLPAAK